MQWRRFLLVCLLQLSVSWPASAGIFFNRQPKVNPEQRVQELIVILKTDTNEGKRASAAGELRQFETKTFPFIVPILIDALQTDPKAGVRVEAAESLGKIRPISQEAGRALEQALAKDASMRVRLTARTSLWQYQLGGYRSGKEEGPVIQDPATSKEPPLAESIDANAVPLPGSAVQPLPIVTPNAGKPMAPVVEPKLAPLPSTSMARPMPLGPAAPAWIPARPAKPEPAPSNSGPVLIAPR